MVLAGFFGWLRKMPVSLVKGRSDNGIAHVLSMQSSHECLGSELGGNHKLIKDQI